MALDPSIILRGQPLDVVGAMRQGNAAAMETNALRQQNQLADVYRTQGAGLLAGDQGALNALAGVDPAAAFNMRGAQQDFAMNNRKMEILNAEEKRAIADAAAQMTAAEKAAAAAQIEDAVKMGLAIQTPEQWDQMMAQQAPELVGQFGNREALAMKYMSMAEILKRNEGPEWMPATPEQAAQYGASGGQISTKTGKFDPINPPSGMSMTTNADGTMTLTQGPGAGKPFTEAQGKDNVFATRAAGALEKLEQPLDPNNPNAGVFADSLAVLQDSAMNSVPLVGNYLTSDNFQVARTAGDEFLQAILRKDTGAAITPPEQQLYGVTYLPQPGDGDARLAYKREARARAVAALQSGMSQQQLEAVARADAAVLAQIEPPAGNANPAPAAPANIPPGAVDLLRQNPTPEYRQSFDEIFGQGAAAQILGGN